MSIRGPQALASLDEAMRDIRREEEDISRRLARSAERITKIKEGEAELFRELAHLRLDPAIQSELDGAISSAETQARDLLKTHARDLSAAEQAVAESDAALTRLTAERAAALAVFEQHQGELKALAGRLGAIHRPRPGLCRQAGPGQRSGSHCRPVDAQDRAGRGRPRDQGQALPRRSAVHVSVGGRLRHRQLPRQQSDPLFRRHGGPAGRLPEGAAQFCHAQRDPAAAARACRAPDRDCPRRPERARRPRNHRHRRGRRQAHSRGDGRGPGQNRRARRPDRRDPGQPRGRYPQIEHALAGRQSRLRAGAWAG